MSTNTSPLDRLPPHSIEAERGVLGCLLTDPNECIPVTEETLHGGASTFYDLRHADLFSVLIGMHRERIPVDLVTVANRLATLGKTEAVGGMLYVSGLMEIQSAANLAYWLGIVREKHGLRRIQSVCVSTLDRLPGHGDDVESALASFERDALAIRDSLSALSDDSDVKAVLRSLVDDWQAAASGKAKPLGVMTGLRELDHRACGMRPGELIVVAARPGIGKTALALNVADHQIRSGNSVGIVSLEMSTKELLTRIACSRASVDARRADDGTLNPEELQRLTVALGELSKDPLYVNDLAGRTCAQIAAKARRWRQRNGIKLLIVDYLGLIRDGQHRRSRYESICDTTAELKALGKELGIPVLLLAQLNRANETDERPPRISDLRDSGSIEQDADFVWLLHPGQPTGPELPVTIITGKARRGPTGQGNLLFRRQFTRFEDRPTSQ